MSGNTPTGDDGLALFSNPLFISLLQSSDCKEVVCNTSSSVESSGEADCVLRDR